MSASRASRQRPAPPASSAPYAKGFLLLAASLGMIDESIIAALSAPHVATVEDDTLVLILAAAA